MNIYVEIMTLVYRVAEFILHIMSMYRDDQGSKKKKKRLIPILSLNEVGKSSLVFFYVST
jgi:hypothetical protein